MLLEEIKILSLRTWISRSDQLMYSLFLPKDPQRSGMILNHPYKQHFHVALWFCRKACPSGNQTLDVFQSDTTKFIAAALKIFQHKAAVPTIQFNSSQEAGWQEWLKFHILIYEPHLTAEQRR